MSEENKNNVVPFPNKLANSEQKNTRFLRTEEGIFRYGRKGDEKSLILARNNNIARKKALSRLVKMCHTTEQLENQ